MPISAFHEKKFTLVKIRSNLFHAYVGKVSFQQIKSAAILKY